MQFEIHPIGRAIPAGYRLATCYEAQVHIQKIQQDCLQYLSLGSTSDQNVRLKNGYLNDKLQVCKKDYCKGIQFKLLVTPSDSSFPEQPPMDLPDLLLALAYACEHDDCREVKELVSHEGQGILGKTIPFQDGGTALHFSAKFGSLPILDYMLSQTEGIKVEARDKLGNTALHVAASRREYNSEITRALIKRGASVRLKNSDGDTPLHLAVKRGVLQAVLDLFSEETHDSVKKWVNLQDKSGETALHVAVRNKSRLSAETAVEIAVALMEREALVDLRNKNGEMALHIAARHGNLQLVKELLSVDRKFSKHNGWKNCLTMCDFSGETVLHEAVKKGQAEVVEELLRCRCFDQRGGREEVVQRCSCLDRRTRVLRMRDDDNVMALDWALRRKDAGLVQKLLSTPHADVYTLFFFLWIPAEETDFDSGLKDVAHRKYLESVRSKLRPTGKHVGRTGPDQRESMLEIAAGHLDPKTVESIIARIKAFGSVTSMLEIAAQHRDLETVKELINGGADVRSIRKDHRRWIRENLPLQASDQPAIKDNLGRTELVKAIAALLLSPYTGTPVTIGIFGEWGMGKSSMMHQVKKTLEDEQRHVIPSGEQPTLLPVWFNAWNYGDKTEASAGLAVAITRALENRMTSPQWLRTCLKFSWRRKQSSVVFQFMLPVFLILTLAIAILLVVWKKVPIKTGYKALSLPITVLSVGLVIWRFLKQVVHTVTETLQSNVGSLPDQHSSRLGYQLEVIKDIKFLQSELREDARWYWFILSFLGWSFIPKKREDVARGISWTNLRIVVFVDDLDRCHDSTILEVLGAINLVLGECEINVVLGIDKGMVEQAIRKTFRAAEDDPNVADKYLRKIIQLPIQLPDPSSGELGEFLDIQLGVPISERNEGDEGEDEQEEVERNEGDEEEEEITEQDQALQQHTAVQVTDTPPEMHDTPEDYALRLLLTNYNQLEAEMIQNLSRQARPDHKIPREWKRFLNYHRLVWNILFQKQQSRELPNLKGWRRELILWIFVCWNWREQMDVIIENWETLLQSQEPKSETQGEPTKLSNTNVLTLGGVIERHIKSRSRKRSDDADVEVEKKALHDTVMHVLSLGGVVDLHVKSRGRNEGDGVQEEVEEKKWTALYETVVNAYDVRMEAIQVFQNYRFHCKLGRLSKPLQDGPTKEKKQLKKSSLSRQPNSSKHTSPFSRFKANLVRRFQHAN